MGLFFYTKKGSIISTVDLPTTEIIEPKKLLGQSTLAVFVCEAVSRLLFCYRRLSKISLTSSMVSARETAPRILAAPAVPRR